MTVSLHPKQRSRRVFLKRPRDEVKQRFLVGAEHRVALLALVLQIEDVELPHAESGRTLQAPGAPYLLSETPWRGGVSAPRIGEHTVEVLNEIVAMEAAV